jgi:tetratricopeptide (TPR) repeat protein
LWAVDSWKPGPHIGGGNSFTPVAFSDDGRLLAVETGLGVVRLVDPDTGREYARLEDPNRDRAGALTFSRDGSQLVTTSNDSHSIHVWDLRAIRERLAKIDLDWDLPPYPPHNPAGSKPSRVQVDLGTLLKAQASCRQGFSHNRSSQWDKAVAAFSLAIELKPDLWEAVEGRRRAYARLGQWDMIIDEYARAIEVHPGRADFGNQLAWLLATCPDPKSRDPKRAVELCEKAVLLAPKDGFIRNLVTLAKSNELLDGKELSFNAFFLAMAHQKLGNQAEARRWNDKAVQWMDKNKPEDEELLRFRAEAAELIDKKK